MKLLLLAALVLYGVSTVGCTRIVCYFPNWATYRTGNGKFTTSNVDANKCTHLIYAFAVLNPTTFTIQIFDTWADISLQGYANFIALKKQNSNLKTMIGLGGYTDSQSSKYSQLVASSANIATFVNSVITFLGTYGFDGIDIDWEYPLSAADKTGFINLLSAFRSAFKSDGYLLSAAVSAVPSAIGAEYDIPSMNTYVDFFNVLDFDFHGSWESQADHHSPLYRRPWDTSNFNTNYSINYWISNGASASKINMGLPFYGRSWTLSSSVTAPPAPASGAGPAGPFTGASGSLAYYEICNYALNSGWTVVQTAGNLMGPYAYSLSAKTWVGYDDVNMVTVKANYVLTNGIGGIMMWDLSTDDFQNTCGGGVNPLLTAIYTTINGGAAATTTTTTTTQATSTTTATTTQATSATTATTTQATATTAVTTQSTTNSPCSNNSPTTAATTSTTSQTTPSTSGTTTTASQTTPSTSGTSTTSTTSNPTVTTSTTASPAGTTPTTVTSSSTSSSATTSTIASPAGTTPTTVTTSSSASSSATSSTTSSTPTSTTGPSTFTCPGQGLYSDPTSCTNFYSCGNDIAYSMSCPAGLYFNPGLLVCDWPSNVICTPSG